MTSRAGIIHYAPNGDLVSLALQEVAAKVIIVDVSARVTLTQIYKNESSSPTSRAKYVFPVPARSAVCAFELHTEDGRVITGIAKEKDEAIQDFNNAISADKMAGLVEWVSDDVATFSVGSIPARQTVTTKIVYVMDLMDDEQVNQVRFHMPVSIGERYGKLPTALEDAASPSTRTRIRVTIDVQTSGRIRKIESPTHHDEVSVEPYMTHSGRPSHRRATAKFRSRKSLTLDFALVVTADGLEEPRCFVEVEKTQSSVPHTLAMQLSVIPIGIPPVPSQEYIFLVDRSGSMSGSPMQTSKRTLVMLLRMLPSDGTRFNVVSFGSHVTSLWPGSEFYSQSTLTHATAHVDQMEADYGGTEILNALSFVFQGRRSDMATAVFVLTDGLVQSTEMNAIQLTVSAAAQDPSLRVYTLGIGETISTGMCEGIARAGNGQCLLASTTEEIVGKCAKLVRAGKSRSVNNVSVNWGIPPNMLVNGRNPTSPSVNFIDTVQQSPPKILRLSPGIRFNVYVLVTLRGLSVPKFVTLHGDLDDGGGPFEMTVPIMEIRLTNARKGPPLVHTLAARRIITDIEEGVLPAHIIAEEHRKMMIVRLGLKYQLASRYTSFVAVDDAEISRMSRERGTPRRDRLSDRSHRDEPNGDHAIPRHGSSLVWSVQNAIVSTGSGFLSKILRFFQQIVISPTVSRGIRFPGDYPSRPPSPISDHHERDGESVRTFSTLSSLNGSSSAWSEWSPPPSPTPLDESTQEYQRSPSPPLPQSIPTMTSAGVIPPSGGTVPQTSSTVRPVGGQIFDLMRLQMFDGSFVLDSSLERIVGQEAVSKASELGVEDRAWATALAIAYLRKHLADNLDLLESIVEKAQQVLKGERNDLLNLAMEVVS